MKKFAIFILLITVTLFAHSADVPRLSKEAQISLLTCSPGEELYSLFGHSAMRVKDPALGIDAVFNYGTFQFNDDFYFNFTMGRLNYRLSISNFDYFIEEYAYEKRSVTEQVLDLDSADKQTIFNFLNWNYLPENRYYLYDFFYDNCSSILRDVLEKNLAERVVFANLKQPEAPSFREMIDEYLVYHPWGDFGIDLGLGLPCDRIPESREYMFLPNNLMDAYAHATLDGKPLVRSTQILLPTQGLSRSFSMFNPVPLFWLILGVVVTLTALGWRAKKKMLALDATLLLVYGAVGALIFFLWLITDHKATVNNLNVLWAWPVHWLAIPLLFFSKARKMYFSAYGIVLVLTLFTFPFLPQMLHAATIPLMLMMLVRSGFHYKFSA